MQIIISNTHILVTQRAGLTLLAVWDNTDAALSVLEQQPVAEWRLLAITSTLAMHKILLAFAPNVDGYIVDPGLATEYIHLVETDD